MYDSEFESAIEELLDQATLDYRRFCEMSRFDFSTDEILERVAEFREGFEFSEGPKYIKIISTKSNQRSVWAFIVKKADNKFCQGDILKPASWSSPAKNQARGNIFGEYTVKWTGPKYL